jgi:CheY-like chemotaxis protein
MRLAGNGTRKADDVDTRHTVLVVEDDEDHRAITTMALEHAGFRVVTATDGVAGVEGAKNERPDLVLMDASLPQMDGWTATVRTPPGATATTPSRSFPRSSSASSATASTASGADAARETVRCAGECEMPSAKCQVPSAKCQVPSAKCQVA